MKKLYLAETEEEKRRMVSVACSLVPAGKGFYFIKKSNPRTVVSLGDMPIKNVELYLVNSDWLGFKSDFDSVESEDRNN